MAAAAMAGLVTELKLLVPWGHIAAKAWGSPQGRPVLCLHGWLDNANTFNKLIPLLPKDCYYMAIDFAGHGLSSHRPAGCLYYLTDYVSDVHRVAVALKWNRFSLMGHSLGSKVAFLLQLAYFITIADIPCSAFKMSVFPRQLALTSNIKIIFNDHIATINNIDILQAEFGKGGTVAGMFSCIFPEMVDKLILVESCGFYPAPKGYERGPETLRKQKPSSRSFTKDALSNLEEWEKELIAHRTVIESLLNVEAKQHQAPKVRSPQEALQRLLEANNHLTEESGKILLERGATEVPGGLVYNRDIRALSNVSCSTPIEHQVNYVKKIQADVLMIIIFSMLTFLGITLSTSMSLNLWLG